jgi:CRISPR-associated protein Csy1
MPYTEYLHLLQVSDVILDTAHFNGQNTTLESFAMGTPVVTLPGRMQRERHGYGMYRAMNFMELVAESETEFVDLAWRVANDREYRDYCRERIESGASKLFEDLNFVRNLEAALVGMVDAARQQSALSH